MNPCTPIDLTIAAADGLPLAASLHGSARPDSLGTLIVAAAVGNVRQNYADYAAHMAADGWDVVTFDYRGIGGSRASREVEAGFTMLDWGAKDLTGIIAWARRRLRPARLVLVGHSIGGQIPALAANHDAVDALIGVAAQRGYWRLWPGWRKLGIYLFWRGYVPLSLKLWGRLRLRWFGLEDIPRAAAAEWARWGLGRDYTDASGASLRPRYARFRAPVLAMSFSDDRNLAPERAVDDLFDRNYVNAPQTRWHLTPEELGVEALGHSGFFRPDVCPRSLWQAVTEWILDSCPGRRRRRGWRHPRLETA